jgi:hypothetical protein
MVTIVYLVNEGGKLVSRLTKVGIERASGPRGATESSEKGRRIPT